MIDFMNVHIYIKNKKLNLFINIQNIQSQDFLNIYFNCQFHLIF